MDRGAWWAAVHGVTRSQTWLGDFTLTFHFHALEKEMATHSSVLAWRIPGTEEPSGLPSMGSHSRTRLKRLSSSRKANILSSLAISWSIFVGWLISYMGYIFLLFFMSRGFVWCFFFFLVWLFFFLDTRYWECEWWVPGFWWVPLKKCWSLFF